MCHKLGIGSCLILALIIHFIVMGCRGMREGRGEGKPLARYKNSYLYMDDIEKDDIPVLPDMDTSQILESKVREWVIQQILNDMVEELPKRIRDDINKRIDKCRDAIIYDAVMEYLMEKYIRGMSMDTTLGDIADLSSFFAPKETIVKVKGLVVRKEKADLTILMRLVDTSSGALSALPQIKKLMESGDVYRIYEGEKWFPWRTLSPILQISEKELLELCKSGRVISKESGNTIVIARIVECRTVERPPSDTSLRQYLVAVQVAQKREFLYRKIKDSIINENIRRGNITIYR